MFVWGGAAAILSTESDSIRIPKKVVSLEENNIVVTGIGIGTTSAIVLDGNEYLQPNHQNEGDCMD